MIYAIKVLHIYFNKIGQLGKFKKKKISDLNYFLQNL